MTWKEFKEAAEAKGATAVIEERDRLIVEARALRGSIAEAERELAAMTDWRNALSERYDAHVDRLARAVAALREIASNADPMKAATIAAAALKAIGTEE